MTLEAKNIKKGDYLLLDDEAYVVLENDHYNKSGSNFYKLHIENFMSNHRSEKHLSSKQLSRHLESTQTTYDLVELLDDTNGKQFLSLLTKDSSKPVESKFVEHDDIIKYLTDYFKEHDTPLSVTFTCIDAPKQHRSESDKGFERVTHLEGFDMKYQHDHHHKHHHVHST